MTPPPDVLARARALFHRLEAVHDEYVTSRWRSALQREAGRQSDAFLALCYLEALGVENPAAWYVLDLQPELAEAFHRWHRHAGIERFPEPGVCC